MIAFDKKLVRILVCDDDASIRDIVGMTLKEDGWTVEIVENGKLGWEAIQSKPYHIVLSDIQMPEMTGMELIEATKKFNPAIEFVIMTSNATLETALTAIKYGAYDYLHKPFDDIAIVPKKMAQVAEKILLRQQNNELLKRLKKASHDLKRLYEFTHELNGVLAIENLQKVSLSGISKVFDASDLRGAWFNKSEGLWRAVTQLPEGKGFEVPDNFADLEALQTRARAGVTLRVEHFPNSEHTEWAFAFDAPQPMIADLLISEVRTCYSKVKMHEDIVSLANRDGLTRLYNHRYFQDRLAQEIAQVKRQHSPLSVVLMDVDNFKHFNDTNGHPAGDRLLVDLARILQTEIGKRASDIVARYGGEEFILALPFTNHEGAMVVAERVRQIIESHPFEHREQQPLGKVSVSIGVATLPDHSEVQPQLIEAADKALYQAKRLGRNRTVSYQDVTSVQPTAVEPVKVEVVQGEAAPVDTSAVETPAVEAPKVETPKVEPPVSDQTEIIVVDLEEVAPERPTIGEVLAATEAQPPAKPAEVSATEASPELPDVFDVNHLVSSIDAAFFEAAKKTELVKIQEPPPVEEKESKGGHGG